MVQQLRLWRFAYGIGWLRRQGTAAWLRPFSFGLGRRGRYAQAAATATATRSRLCQEDQPQRLWSVFNWYLDHRAVQADRGGDDDGTGDSSAVEDGGGEERQASRSSIDRGEAERWVPEPAWPACCDRQAQRAPEHESTHGDGCIALRHKLTVHSWDLAGRDEGTNLLNWHAGRAGQFSCRKHVRENDLGPVHLASWSSRSRGG